MHIFLLLYVLFHKVKKCKFFSPSFLSYAKTFSRTFITTLRVKPCTSFTNALLFITALLSRTGLLEFKLASAFVIPIHEDSLGVSIARCHMCVRLQSLFLCPLRICFCASNTKVSFEYVSSCLSIIDKAANFSHLNNC